MSKPEYKIKRSNGVTETIQLFDVIDPSDVWPCGKINIISLVGLQKIAEKENIVEKKFEMIITPNKDNYQQHGVNIWLGFAGESNPDFWVRGSGEACKLNTGKFIKNSSSTDLIYEEIDHIDSKYRLAMAEKRAYCRAMLKLIKLYGYYGDQESPEFQNSNKQADDFSTGQF